MNKLHFWSLNLISDNDLIIYYYFFKKSNSNPSKLTLRRIEHETLRGEHSKFPNQHHHVNPSGLVPYFIFLISFFPFSSICISIQALDLLFYFFVTSQSSNLCSFIYVCIWTLDLKLKIHMQMDQNCKNKKNKNK